MNLFRLFTKVVPDSTSQVTVSSHIIEAASMLATARKVAVLTGAGMSAESGLKTFRAKVAGIWESFDASAVATPSAFRKDPEKVMAWHESMREACIKAEPNPGHRALAAMQELVPELQVLTQNIDGLHQRAGSRHVLEVHGNIFRMKGFCDPDRHGNGLFPVHCPVCRGCTASPAQWNPAQRNAITEFVDVKDGVLPRCPHCSGPLRHDIVWFGEALDPYVMDAAWRIADECDVMLVIGCSLQVQPMAGLPWRAGYRKAKIIEINPSPAEASGFWAVRIEGSAALVLPQLLSAWIRCR